MTDQNQQASEAGELRQECNGKVEIRDGHTYWMGTKVNPCPKCGVAPTNVDDCGEFGNPECPYFGIGRTEVGKSTPKCDAEAVERIAGLICAKVNLGSEEYNKLFRADVFEILTQALQSRDAENARLNERVRELEQSERLSRQLAASNKLVTNERFAELEQAEADRDRISAELARVKKAGSKMEAALQRTLDVYPIMAMKAGVKGDIEDALKEYRNWKENSNMLTPEQREEI